MQTRAILSPPAYYMARNETFSRVTFDGLLAQCGCNKVNCPSEPRQV